MCVHRMYTLLVNRASGLIKIRPGAGFWACSKGIRPRSVSQKCLARGWAFSGHNLGRIPSVRTPKPVQKPAPEAFQILPERVCTYVYVCVRLYPQVRRRTNALASAYVYGAYVHARDRGAVDRPRRPQPRLATTRRAAQSGVRQRRLRSRLGMTGGETTPDTHSLFPHALKGFRPTFVG